METRARFGPLSAASFLHLPQQPFSHYNNRLIAAHEVDQQPDSTTFIMPECCSTNTVTACHGLYPSYQYGLHVRVVTPQTRSGMMSSMQKREHLPISPWMASAFLPAPQRDITTPPDRQRRSKRSEIWRTSRDLMLSVRRT